MLRRGTKTDKFSEKELSINALLKEEILAHKFNNKQEKFAFLSGFIRGCGTLGFTGGVREYTLTINAYSDVATTVVDNIVFSLYRERGKSLRRNEITYTGELAKNLLLECGVLYRNGEEFSFSAVVPKNFSDTALADFVVMGYFVSSGNITVGDGYNLSFSTVYIEQCQNLRKILQARSVKVSEGVHKDRYMLYIKSNESISTALAIMKARKALFEFSNIVANRQYRSYFNRTTNCEVHNLGRTVNASVRTRTSINELMNNGAITDAKLLETARARIENPHASYEELANILGISKSGVRHRLNKLDELAENRKEKD